MAFTLRPRPRQVALETVEHAVMVAMRPDRLTGVPQAQRAAVKQVADVLVAATRPEIPARLGKPLQPMRAVDLARKAAQDLAPTRLVATPEVIEVAMRRQGLDFVEPFSPGRPLTPFIGYDKRPRQYNYMPGRNITTDTRPNRLPFDSMKQIFEGYDIAMICARHIINDIRSMGLLFKPMDGYHGNVAAELKEAKRFLRKPDGRRNFNTWFAAWAMDVLRYDAGCLWKERNRGGQLTHLKYIDGTTIMPLIDFYGDVPDGDAPAYQQIIQGIPWADLNAKDVIYEPQWPVTESPYGVAPIETCLINANTDVRLQMFFLEFFTEGAVPEMLLSAPEGMSDPDALAELQETWDAWFQNNQKGRHGAWFIPAGEKPFVYKPYTFDPKLAEYVARRTIAAFGLVPQDLGILDQVNKSSSESQVDTQFRLTTLPNTEYYEAILNEVLQDDLQLPIAVTFDTGREREDRLMEARVHQVYVDMGAESPDEVRSDVLGKPVDPRLRVPRFIDNQKLGPITLESLESQSGDIDPETLAPVPSSVVQRPPMPLGQPLMTPATQGAQQAAQAQQAGQQGAAPQANGAGTPPAKPQPKVKAKADAKAKQAAKATAVATELAAFRRFAKRRVDAGRWRDFTFEHLDVDLAAQLNGVGRDSCAKAAGEPPIAGLALRARDTGRVLMLQRAHTDDDPAAGALEFPGGHLEDGETSAGGAIREWEEETGLDLPDSATSVGSWDSGNGIYRGHVYEIGSESMLDLANRDMGANPDGDGFEAILWLDPADLSMNPTVRRELANDAHLVTSALGRAAKAGGVGPKAQQQQRRRRAATAASSTTSGASGAASALRPGPWGHLEALLVAHWTIAIAGALATVITASTIARRWLLEHQGVTNIPAKSDAARDLARSFGRLLTFDDKAFRDTLHELYVDAYLAGGKDALEQTPDAHGPFVDEINRIDWGAWQPGHPDASRLVADGGFQRLLDSVGVRIKGIDDTTRNLIAKAVEDGLAQGWSVQQIADAIDAALQDPKRAHLIAVTEVNRAMSAASAAMYRDNGVPMWDLLTAADPCPICADIAAHNPHRWGDGTPLAPEHPQCRCAIAPHYEEGP